MNLDSYIYGDATGYDVNDSCPKSVEQPQKRWDCSSTDDGMVRLD